MHYVIQQLQFLATPNAKEPTWVTVKPFVDYISLESAQAAIDQFHPGRRAHMRISEE